jgi:hypothetical protein
MSMRFQIVIIEPPNYQHSGAVAELAETLVFGFRALGYPARVVANVFAADAVNIVLCAHFLSPQAVGQLPSNTVIYNLEQVEDSLFQWAPVLRELFARFEVWDYSVANIRSLQSHAPRLFHVPVGAVPELTRIAPAAEQDIDVLFYGAVNDRRRTVLKAIAESGLVLKAVFGAYGAARDALIARSKIVLNLHKHDAQVFEVVRVSYLLLNRKAVVSEICPTTEIEADLADAIAGVAYDGLVDRCRALAADPQARRALEQRGYERMTARPETAYLQAVLRQRVNG